MKTAENKQKAEDLNGEKQRNMSRELEILRHEENRQTYFDELVTSYIHDIEILLEKYNGSLGSNPTANALATAETLHILPLIGPLRTAQLIRFLYKAGQLTTGKNPLDMTGAH